MVWKSFKQSEKCACLFSDSFSVSISILQWLSDFDICGVWLFVIGLAQIFLKAQ